MIRGRGRKERRRNKERFERKGKKIESVINTTAFRVDLSRIEKSDWSVRGFLNQYCYTT